MIISRLYLSFIFVLSVSSILAQEVRIETLPSTAAQGVVNIYGRGTLSGGIPYDKITGSQFWSDEWKPATLYGRDPNFNWERMVKINLVTNQTYFLDDKGQEQVVNDSVIRKISFHAINEPLKVNTIFLAGLQMPYGSTVELKGFVQILNMGKYQLLKQNLRVAMEGDSMFGTLKRYYFKDNIKYYFAINNNIIPVKNLNKDAFLFNLPNQTDYAKWISENKINLRKEVDVLEFLAYLNSEK